MNHRKSKKQQLPTPVHPVFGGSTQQILSSKHLKIKTRKLDFSSACLRAFSKIRIWIIHVDRHCLLNTFLTHGSVATSSWKALPMLDMGTWPKPKKMTLKTIQKYDSKPSLETYRPSGCEWATKDPQTDFRSEAKRSQGTSRSWAPSTSLGPIGGFAPRLQRWRSTSDPLCWTKKNRNKKVVSALFFLQPLFLRPATSLLLFLP